MNVISLTLWTLEKNCFIVYTALVVCFIAFTIFHKNKLEAHYRAQTKKENLPRSTFTKKGLFAFLFITSGKQIESMCIFRRQASITCFVFIISFCSVVECNHVI